MGNEKQHCKLQGIVLIFYTAMDIHWWSTTIFTHFDKMEPPR